MTSKNNRALLLYYVKLCVSFQIHQWIQTGVTVRKYSIGVEIDILSCVTLKFDGWPWKTIGHLFYTTPSFVHHFKAIDEVKLSRVTVRKRSIRVKISVFFVQRDHEIWRITLKINRAPLLYYIKLCASFQGHGWIQTEVTVRKRSNRVEISNFLSPVTLKFNEWPWKSIGHLSYVASSCVCHFITIGEFKLELQSGNAQFGSKSTIYLAVWPWNLMDDLEKHF